MSSVLVVEDTLSLQALYRGLLSKAGYRVTLAATGAEARRLFAQLSPQVVCLDLGLPDCDGLELMRELLQQDHRAHFIVITADGSVHRAVELMRAGAREFLVKPFDEKRLLTSVQQAVQEWVRPSNFNAAPDSPAPFENLIGSSRAMRRVYDTIEAVSASMAPVFITGESGTGKELCAQAVHLASPRRHGPFVPMSCSAIPRDRIESEVFGHLQGAMPGALSDKAGAASAAQGGTLFLDEVCEMDLHMQAKLLHLLQTNSIKPVGSSVPNTIDVRIIAATNHDPLRMVREGRFREDLYYRLHVVPIHLPPLRSRDGDVIEIAEVMLDRFSRTEGRRFTGLSEEVQILFQSYGWPGNVRELRNVLWNIVLLNEGPVVTPAMLPNTITGAGTDGRTDANDSGPADVLEGMTLAEAERLVIERAIDRASGSVPRAARALDVAPSTIYRKRAAWMQRGSP